MAISLCSTNVGNTGVIGCDPSPGRPKILCIWNGSKAQSAITGSAFQTFLATSSKLSKNDPDKIFVFPVIQNIEDKSAADTEGSLNQGYTTTLVEGLPAYDYKVFAGPSTVKQLRKFNGQTVRTLTIDKNNRGWGTASGTNFIGQQARIKVSGLKYASGQDVAEGVVTISVSFLEASELNDDAAYGDVTSTSSIVGLLDANVVETVAHTSNVYKIGLQIPTAKVGAVINLHDTYATQLSSASMWVAKTGATYSTTLAITTVADDTVNGGWTVTLDATAWGLLSSGAAKIKFVTAAPPTLDASDVPGIEGIEVYLAK